MKLARWLAILVGGVGLGVLATANPEWNFDCIAYAGVARLYLGQSSHELHADAYADLQRAASSKHAEQIMAGSAYRQALADDPRLFWKQLPFYTNKPLYVALAAAAAAAGANSVKACFLVSAVAYGFLGCLVLLWLTQLAGDRIGWSLGGCLLLSAQVFELGRLGSPDALGTLLVVAALYALIQRRSMKLGVLLLVASLSARPDNLFLTLAVLGWLAMYGLISRRSAVLSALVCMAATAWALSLTGSYSWHTLFVHTFVRRVITDADFQSASVELREYFRALARGLSGGFVLHPSIIFVYVGWTIIFLACARRSRHLNPMPILLFHLALWLAAAIHFVTFPMLADRFFVAHYLGISISSVAFACAMLPGNESHLSFFPQSASTQ